LFFEATGAVVKIGLSLKPNHHKEIWLAQICETFCTKLFLIHYRYQWLIGSISILLTSLLDVGIAKFVKKLFQIKGNIILHFRLC